MNISRTFSVWQNRGSIQCNLPLCAWHMVLNNSQTSVFADYDLTAEVTFDRWDIKTYWFSMTTKIWSVYLLFWVYISSTSGEKFLRRVAAVPCLQAWKAHEISDLIIWPLTSKIFPCIFKSQWMFVTNLKIFLSVLADCEILHTVNNEHQLWIHTPTLLSW